MHRQCFSLLCSKLLSPRSWESKKQGLENAAGASVDDEADDVQRPHNRVLTQGTSHGLEHYGSIAIFQRAEIGRLRRTPFCSPRRFIHSANNEVVMKMARSQ